MAKFIVHTHPHRKKMEVFYFWFWIVVTVLFFASLFFIDWGDFKAAARSVTFILLFWSAMDRLRKKKKEHFIEITEESIEWLVSEEENKTLVPWNDIRWIKRESDGGITLFQESSFSKHFLLTQFLEEDRKAILDLLQQTGNTRQIRLINFSEEVSVAV